MGLPLYGHQRGILSVSDQGELYNPAIIKKRNTRMWMLENLLDKKLGWGVDSAHKISAT